MLGSSHMRLLLISIGQIFIITSLHFGADTSGVSMTVSLALALALV